MKVGFVVSHYHGHNSLELIVETDDVNIDQGMQNACQIALTTLEKS